MNKKVLLYPLLSLPATMACARPSAPEKPNILMILVDDLGWADLSCQGYAQDIKTPNIDRLMAEGIRFTNFHANSAVSSPSRAALMTGCYSDVAGVPGVIRTPRVSDGKTVGGSWGYFRTDLPTIADKLKEGGYHTGIVGKWHLGVEPENLPNKRGFDHFHGFLGDMMDDYYTHLRGGRNFMRLNEQEIDPQGHATDIFSDWAVDYLNSRKGKKEPFFLYLAYNAPHNPIQPPAEYLERVKQREKGIDEKRAALVALIEHMDSGVGKVMDALKKNGQMDNTLIVFASDNGGYCPAGANNGPYNGCKGQMYEGGIRVAMGACWKGKIRPGSVTDNFAMHMDLFPTFCEVAGVPITHQINGQSILPTLISQKQDTDNRAVVDVRLDAQCGFIYAMQQNGYKILKNKEAEDFQLFRIEEDPYEQNPLDTVSNPYYRVLKDQMDKHIEMTSKIPWQKK